METLELKDTITEITRYVGLTLDKAQQRLGLVIWKTDLQAIPTLKHGDHDGGNIQKRVWDACRNNTKV